MKKEETGFKRFVATKLPGVSRLKDASAWKFAKSLRADNHFWTRMGGLSAGGSHIFRAGIFLALLASAPVAGQIFGMAACSALIGIGLLGIRHGLPGAWKSLEEHCDKHFSKLNPMRKIRIRAQNLATKISEKPSVQKLNNRAEKLAGKVVQHPRFKKTVEKPVVQKILNNRLVRAYFGLSPKQQHIFLAGLTIEQSLISVAVYAVGAAALIGGAPAGALAIISAGLAYQAGTSLFSFYNGAKTLKLHWRDGKNKKESGAKETIPAPTLATTPSQKIKAPGAPENRTSAFNGNAARTPYRKSTSVQIIAPPLPPARYRMPAPHRMH